MAEEDIRKFLAGQSQKSSPKKNAVTGLRTRSTPMARRGAPRAPQQDVYENFAASHLYCHQCKQAMPVREKVLLYLPSGTLSGYLCTGCGDSLGTRTT